MRQLFWKTCCRVEFKNEVNTLLSVQFFRGFVWDIVEEAVKVAKEKSEKEKINWIVYDIRKI